MGNLQAAARANLRDWEAWLAPQVRQVTLLGEIPITEDQCKQLGKAIGLRVKGLGHGRALKILEDNYPCSLAVYLVAQGVYGYEGGDYWSEVIEVTHLNRTYAWQVGQAFEEILERMGLPLFYEMRAEGAHRYVGPILAHGGIPNYCLSDFYDKMLQPSVLKAEYDSMSTAELIDEWRWRSSAHYFIDKPVLRFLTYGGRVAEDFVERCREMARQYADTGLVPDAGQVGLPQRVVERYGEWVAAQEGPPTAREQEEGWRLRKPEIRVDPWGLGVVLDLPPQQVPATQIQARIQWEVAAEGERRRLEVRVRRAGFDWKTVPETTPLIRPAATYEVSLLADGEVKRTWRPQGLDAARPLLVFEPGRGAVLPWQTTLPRRALGLLYPAGARLEVDGPSQVLETLPRIPWGWSAYRAELLDLCQARVLRVIEDGRPALSVTMVADESAEQPVLQGGALLSAGGPGAAPVYGGSPPCVRISLVGRQSADEELARWHVVIRNKWAADPAVQLTQTLAQMRHLLAKGDGYVDLLLRHPSLLGEQPFGSYVVHLRGPLGRGAEFTLRVVPDLTVLGHDRLHLPDPEKGPQPARVEVEHGAGEWLECRGEGGQCQVQAVPGSHGRQRVQITADPGVTEIELTVARSLPTGDTVRVPVLLPIRRLCWALVAEGMEVGQPEWCGQALSRPVEALSLAESACLLVQLPLSEPGAARLTLRLLEADGSELQVTSRPAPRRGHLWRFDLGEFMDTVRQAIHSAVLHLALEAHGLPGQQEEVRWHVLSLTRALTVERVSMETVSVDGQILCDLTWHERVPLRNRMVRLWQLWRPWEPPLEQRIPDPAAGELVFQAPSDRLVPGRVRLQFVVVDPWVPTAASPGIPPQGSDTADLELVSPEERLAAIEAVLHSGGRRFDLVLERAFIHRDLADFVGARTDCEWCREYLNQGTIAQVLALAELVRSLGDAEAQKVLSLRMFAPANLERLLRERAQGMVSGEQFRVYLAHLSRPELLGPAAARILLAAPDEALRLMAAQRLVRDNQIEGPEAVLAWVEKAEMSDSDAVAILKQNANLSLDFLERRIRNPTALRLLEALAEQAGERALIVRPGIWVYCDAGWGRLERIEDRMGQVVEWFLRGQSGYRLHVALRPGKDGEPIILDQIARRIDFPKATVLWTCTKCDGFTARDCYLIVNEHNRVSHGNVGPSFRRESGPVRSLERLIYSARAPVNLFDIPGPAERASERG